MRKHALILTLTLLSSAYTFGQQRSFKNAAAEYFAEIKTVTAEHKDLWGCYLYSPILLVRPDTREVFANQADTAGVLQQDGSVFTGTLPNAVNIANTSIRWNGVQWAMLILPLPERRDDRLNLLAHELFHRAQPQLGFVLYNVDNNHLDQKEGRAYLRLELEALKAAVLAGTHEAMKESIANALTFRLYRYAVYPGADSTENRLELNEGIAEYTGMMMSGRTNEQQQTHFTESIQQFLTNPTFVRSFAYQTTPMYGYMLYGMRSGWNKEITTTTNLTEYFLKAFGVEVPKDLKSSVTAQIDQYNGQQIFAEETAREATIKKLIAENKRKYIEQPHLEIPLIAMNVSFDPRNIMPLEDKGTVYPNIRITDKWGILTVKSGALVSSDWKKVSLSIPIDINEKKIVGEGWVLELEEGYNLVKMEEGNYKLIHK